MPDALSSMEVVTRSRKDTNLFSMDIEPIDIMSIGDGAAWLMGTIYCLPWNPTNKASEEIQEEDSPLVKMQSLV